jgi:hypothetical protein
MTRARAAELIAASPPAAARPRVARGASDRQAAVNAMTGDVKLLLGLSAIVVVAGLGWLALGSRPEPYPALLGYVDAGPPKAPLASGYTEPPFKLPWWK